MKVIVTCEFSFILNEKDAEPFQPLSVSTSVMLPLRPAATPVLVAFVVGGALVVAEEAVDEVLDPVVVVVVVVG